MSTKPITLPHFVHESNWREEYRTLYEHCQQLEARLANIPKVVTEFLESGEDLVQQLAAKDDMLQAAANAQETLHKHYGEQIRAKEQEISEKEDMLIYRMEQIAAKDELIQRAYSFVEDAITYYSAYPDFTPEWSKGKQWLADANKVVK